MAQITVEIRPTQGYRTSGLRFVLGLRGGFSVWVIFTSFAFWVRGLGFEAWGILI